MKLNSILTIALLVSSVSSNAANVFISNAGNGGGDPLNDIPADTLYARNDNSLMVGGIVTVGYFEAITVSTDIDTIEELVPLLSGFNVITSISPGTTANNTFATGPLPGYADQFGIIDPTEIVGSPAGLINSGNTLFNRELFAIITNAPNLLGATLNSEFGVFSVGKLIGDSPTPLSFVVNPNATQGALIGTFGTKLGDFSQAGSDFTFSTYKLAVVPEPSTTLLGAIGALALLRRRRN